MKRHFDNEVVGGAVFESDGGYALRTGKREMPLTNFLWKPVLELRNPDGAKSERGYLVIKGGGEHIITVSVHVWNSRRDLAEVVGRYGGLLVASSNSQVARVRQHIIENTPELPVAVGVNTYGLHPYQGDWTEVYTNRPFSNAETEERLFYTGASMDDSSSMFDGPPMAATKLIDEARNKFGLLLQLTDKNFAGAMLGYTAASPFAPRITPLLANRLPFLYAAGEKESGKSSFGEICLELATGRRSRVAKAIKLTPYQYDAVFANANNLLALLDEYRNGTSEVDEQIRKHHDLGRKMRGSGKAGADHSYYLNAPMIVLGENFTDDAATLSRGALYFVGKADRGTPALFREVLEVPWWAYAYRLHQQARHLDDVDHMARFDLAQARVDAAAPSISPRLRHALTFIAYGLLTLQADVDDGTFSDEFIYNVLRCGVDTTIGGGTESATNIEMFLEQLGAIALAQPRPEVLVSPAVAPNQIIIRASPSVMTVSSEFRGKTAISNNRLLIKYAEESGFFEKGSVHRTFWGGTVRGLLLNLTRVPERCDVSGLVELNDYLRRRDNVTRYAKAS